METYGHHLSDGELQQLRQFLGTPVYLLYAFTVEVAECRVVADSFALLGPDDCFVIIGSDWRDTPRDAIDYHIMTISAADSLDGIRVERDEEGDATISAPHSTILLQSAEAVLRIVSVRVREGGEQERVRYDAALVFEYEGGQRFMIAANASIEGGVQYSAVKDDIDEVCRQCVERVAIEGR